LYNPNDFPCIYLDVPTTIGIDVCDYPDSGKVNILPDIQVFESSSSVDYYTGEENVAAKWPKELLRKKQAVNIVFRQYNHTVSTQLYF
jgi:hypothetical protein